MEANNDSFDVISNTEAELIDKAILLHDSDAGCNYLNLIADCISKISQTEQAQDDNCSVEVISETCKVNKYYSETAATVVENHFTRSLPAQTSLKLIEANMNEGAPVKKTGTVKRAVSSYYIYCIIGRALVKREH